MKNDHDLNQKMITFFENSFEVSKGPYKYLIEYFPERTTLLDLLNTKGQDIARYPWNFGLKSYLKVCDDLKSLGFKTSYPIFNYRKEAKRKTSNNSVPMNERLRSQRISLLKKLMKELQEKSIGFVKNEEKYSSLLKQAEDLI